jgi:hypothetical protein
MRLPARDRSADAATVRVRHRNVPRARSGLRGNGARVAGQVADWRFSEFGVPRIPGVSALYLWYFRRCTARSRPDESRVTRAPILSACVGWHVSTPRRVRDNTETGRLCRGSGSPSDLRHRLPLHGREGIAAGFPRLVVAVSGCKSACYNLKSQRFDSLRLRESLRGRAHRRTRHHWRVMRRSLDHRSRPVRSRCFSTDPT